MVGESNQNVFFIQIDALSFAEFEMSEYKVSRVDCMLLSKNKISVTWLIYMYHASKHFKIVFTIKSLTIYVA